MQITIDKAPHEMRIQAFRSMDFSEVECLDDAAEKIWSGLFYDIMNRKHSILYYDGHEVIKPEYHSFMRYALHRSTKKDGFLQMSVMEYRNGEMIPTSDRQYSSVSDFLRDVPNNVNVTVM